jgi:hypothetical protein
VTDPAEDPIELLRLFIQLHREEPGLKSPKRVEWERAFNDLYQRAWTLFPKGVPQRVKT